MDRVTEGLGPNDAREVVRVVAGILIAIGMALIGLRRGSPELFGDGTSNFVLFLVFAAPAAFLYGTGVLGRRLGGEDRRWQALYTVAGVLLLPVALFYLVAAIDSTYDGELWTIVIFALSAGACVFAWLTAAVRFQLLLGGLYAAIAWTAFIAEVLGDDPSVDTFRWLVLLFAVALAAAAFFAGRAARVEREETAGELLTAAGITALVVYLIGPYITLEFVSIGADVSVESVETYGGFDLRQDWYWDVLTLLTGSVLVVLGLGRGLRGPVYVGAGMLAVFTVSVGLDLDSSTPEGKILGWPLLLCVLGAAGFLLSLVPGDRVPPVLGRFFRGGREGAAASAAAPTWQLPPEPAEPAAESEVPTPSTEEGATSQPAPAGEPAEGQPPGDEEPPRA